MTHQCEQFQSTLLDLAYADPPADADRATHLAAIECPHCRQALAEIWSTRKLLRVLPLAEPGHDLDAALLQMAQVTATERAGATRAKLRQEVTSRSPIQAFWARMLIPVATAAVVLLVSATTFFLFQHSPSPISLPAEPPMDFSKPSSSPAASPGAPLAAKPAPVTRPREQSPLARPATKESTVRANGLRFEDTAGPKKQTAQSIATETRGKPSPAAGASSGADLVPTRQFDKGDDAAEMPASAQGDCLTEIAHFSQTAKAVETTSPQLTIALHRLARCEKQVGRLTAALDHYKQLLQSSPQYAQRPSALLEAAICHRRLGQVEEARHKLNELQLFSGYEDAAKRELDLLK